MRAVLWVLLVFMACASPSSQRSSFDATRHPWLLEAIQSQRPELLRQRRGSTKPLVVEVNGSPVPDGVAVLRTIRTRDVVSVRRVDLDLWAGGSVLKVAVR